MAVTGSKSQKNTSKQLLLVLLFILACLLLSSSIKFANQRNPSDLVFEDGAFHIPQFDYVSGSSVCISDNLIFVPNVDYENIESGSFYYEKYTELPYADNVEISLTEGWSDLGPDAKWHNCDDYPQFAPIHRAGKIKHAGTYLVTFKFEDADDTYYLSLPDTDGLVRIYCNGVNLGFLWGRQNEWDPSVSFGSGFVPIIPDNEGYARIMITISTNELIHTPGILSYLTITESYSSERFTVVPALWLMVQLMLFLFILVGGFLISRTFKNKASFYILLATEFLALLYTLIDCHFISYDSYTHERFKFGLFIGLSVLVYLLIHVFAISNEDKKRFPVLRITPFIIVLAGALTIIIPISSNQPITTTFPILPEIIFTGVIILISGFNALTSFYRQESSLHVSIIEVCYIFACVNIITQSSGIYNLPTYSVFLVIANLTLEFYFISRYVIQARTLEDTMEHMQFIVQEKTMRISEINRDLYKTNKKLMENEQARKTVLSNVSHDLRTPITAIRGYAELLLSTGKTLPDENKINYLKNIIRRSEQMERIISDIVELTRLESNANEFQFTDVSICELLDEVIMIYEADLIGTSKSISLDIPEDDLLIVKADPKKLSRVFENLISNAINYSFEEAKIEIKAWREGEGFDIEHQTVHIDVKDNGIGIPKEEIPMIFDRFYRAKNSGQNIKGTGIGLSIVKTIIDRHDAKISVESAIGTGTTFHIVMKATY